MTNSPPQLSILIPTYNREKYIEQAIDSVLNQDFQDFEIICSDNGSTDNTFKILYEYQRRDKRIKVYQNRENLGPIPNWKNCLDYAKGEYVHWLWSDDWIEANFYIDSFALMNDQNTKIVTSWNYRSDNEKDLKDKYVSWCYAFPEIVGYSAAKKILLGTGEIPASPAAYILPTKLVRKHFYSNIPKFSELLDPTPKGVGADSLMIAGCCFEVEKLSVLQKPSVVFRQHDNLSAIYNRDGSLGHMRLLSHLWYLSNHRIRLGAVEYLRLVKGGFSMINSFNMAYQVFHLLVGALVNSLLSKDANYSAFDDVSTSTVFKAS